jgi:hypothetical protein
MTQHYRADGIIGYWSFDKPMIIDDALQRGTINDGTRLVPGRYGKGRKFYGPLDNTITPHRLSFKELGRAYTISFWINVFESKDLQPILRNKQGSLNHIWIQNGNLYFLLPEHKREYRTFVFPMQRRGEFTHIAFVVDLDNKKLRFYENGVLNLSYELGECYNRNDEMAFGQKKAGDASNFILDELILRNRVLSPKEIEKEARSKISLPYRFDASRILKLKFFRSLRRALQAWDNRIDLFNPFYHESYVHKTDLPRFNFFLSDKDLKAFNKFHSLSLMHGIVPEKISTTRNIKIKNNKTLLTVQMELCGEAYRLAQNGKKTFSIQFLEDDHYKGMKKITFTPPETNGLLKPLFESHLAKKYHLLHPKGDLGIVFINGIYQGLYYFENSGLFRYREDYYENWRIEPLLKQIPAFTQDLLREYDALAKIYTSLFIRDRSSFLGSREIFYRIKRDRAKLETLISHDLEKNDKNRLEKAKNYLTEKIILGENPASTYLLHDLDLSIHEINGVKIRWESDNPKVINSHGKIFRPALGPAPDVKIHAHFSSGNLTDTKSFHFTVIPQKLEMNFLRIRVESSIVAFEWTPCLIEWIDERGMQQKNWLPGKIKHHGVTALHYAKKSFKIRFDQPQTFMDFTPSKDFILTSSHADRTLMRNQLTYDLFRSFSTSDRPSYAPNHHMIELSIDGVYEGVYEICEIVDANTVGLNPYNPNDSHHSVLYKAWGNEAGFSSFGHSSYEQKEPHVKHGNHWKPYEELIAFLGTSPREVFEKEVEKIIDIDNVIDFQIILNFAFNTDGTNHNLFIARNNRNGDRFFIIPWDYDKSLGGAHDQILSNHLIDRLMSEFPNYKSRLRARWQELRKTSLSEKALMERIDNLEDLIRSGAERNYKTRPLPESESHERYVNHLREWIRKRLIFMDGWIKNLDIKNSSPNPQNDISKASKAQKNRLST